MSEYERGYCDALKSALVSVEGRLGLLADPHCSVAAALREAARQIRVLAPRIPPAPDDETLVKDLAEHMSKSHGCDWPCEDPKYCQCIEEAAQAVKFLREAGALR